MLLIIASKNKNKIIEIKNKFSKIKDLEIRALSEYKDAPDVIESGNTFKENALIKAIEISKFTGMAVLADDSGLVVDALNGEPGIYSARYGGEGLDDSGRTDLLLENLKKVPENKRTARFICSIAIVLPDGQKFSTEGKCEGIIALEKRGDSGFGYDPVFILPNSGKTMSEIDLNEKNKISHRAIALGNAEKILAEVQNDIKS